MNLATSRPIAPPTAEQAPLSRLAITNSNGHKLCVVGLPATSATTRSRTTAGAETPRIATDFRNEALPIAHDIAAAAMTTMSDGPSNALGRLSLLYGINQYGTPTAMSAALNPM